MGGDLWIYPETPKEILEHFYQNLNISNGKSGSPPREGERGATLQGGGGGGIFLSILFMSVFNQFVNTLFLLLRKINFQF